MVLHTPIAPIRYKRTIRVLYTVLLCIVIIYSIGFTCIIYTKQVAFDLSWQDSEKIQQIQAIIPFPISVYPEEKYIADNSITIDSYLENTLSYDVLQKRNEKIRVLDFIISKLTQLNWYQNLASPSGRIIVINPGARKEEVIGHISKILQWTDTEAVDFERLVTDTPPTISEGKFFPARYLVSKDASPEDIASILIDRFHTEILSRYTPEVSNKVPLNKALIIASLLQREAYDFTDMREISGIIWNRLFIGMNLQIDATLQYANGTTHPQTWYPPVIPSDKYIDSPFNTYKHEGLPPAPIGNPTTAAVLAALNPVPTDCLFYFHDRQSQFHCSTTYKEHVRLLKQYYGQGK